LSVDFQSRRSAFRGRAGELPDINETVNVPTLHHVWTLEEWNDITKNIKADIVVMDMPFLDTTQYKDSLLQ
jgi:hypothetical protein